MAEEEGVSVSLPLGDLALLRSSEVTRRPEWAVWKRFSPFPLHGSPQLGSRGGHVLLNPLGLGVSSKGPTPCGRV